VVAQDEGLILQCRVTGANADATAQAVSAPVVADPEPAFALPVQTTVGDVSGSPTVADSLFCAAGSWEGSPKFSFQWLRNGVEIATATNPSYTITPADRDSTLQCRVTATNASGIVVAINADDGAVYVEPNPPAASATLPLGGLAFGGVRNGNVFYADGPMNGALQTPADLFSFNTSTQTTTRITDVGDALFVNVSDDGSHVYFVSESQIGGEGVDGQPNLYLWTREGDSTSYVATVDPTDLAEQRCCGQSQRTALAQWAYAVGPEQELQFAGLGVALSRATPDGSVLVFASRAQLGAFDNTAQNLGECGAPLEGLETLKCLEVYRYDSSNGELICLSCPAGSDPPRGDASFQSYGFGFLKTRPLTHLTPPTNLTTDGSAVFFESPESLLPEDGNDALDVYRWKEGSGLALISTGQATSNSFLYSMTPNGSDVLIVTGQQLRPEDENGGTAAIYDARVNGGFPPPEKTVTEPCSGDACQGAPAPAPTESTNASASVEGGGNVTSAPAKRCAKGKRTVRRNGKPRCVAKKRHKKHRRTAASRGAAR
jgi:hypothetical protein